MSADPEPNTASLEQRGQGRGAQIAADVAAGARAAAPRLAAAARRFGDWLASVGWGKFFLLSLLVLVAGAMLNSWLFEGGPAIVVEASDPKDRVNVIVSVTPEGIRVAPPTPADPPAPPAAPAPEPPPADSAAGAQHGDAEVKVGKEGVRIVTNRDGKRVVLRIDGKGVRIEEPAAGAPQDSAPGGETAVPDGSVVIPPGVLADPGKAEEAIESVRERIEAIVQDQVSEQVARTTRAYRERSSDWFMSFLMLLIVTSVIAKVLLGGKRKAETRARAASATAAEEGLKRQLVEAQLKMMQAQVEPHFLFNTLASVDYLIETDPARASTMQKNLIQYLRAALPQMREGSTTLGKELALVRSYLEILKVRMDDRLQFAITVPQGLMSAQFPPMVLQSLVENAIKHALEPKPEGGSITVNADIANGGLRVTVADTGLGFGAAGRPGTGVGLANVRERLAALYGGRARFAIEANAPTGTIATVEVPYEPDLSRGASGQPLAGAAA
ncbi:MAG: histidine kinase [Burkholderiaceae bacterium]|jgi:signal transduction histidine kinase|nr:histidine kinase [Burkholderiaceae bacterium]